MTDWTQWIPVTTEWRESATRLGTLEGRWDGDAWQGIALSAVLASFFMLAIAYMLSKAFNHQGLRKWVQAEVYNVFANGLLVVGLVALVGIILSATTTVTAEIATSIGALEYIDPGTGIPTGVTVDNPFVLAQLFIDENLQCLKTWYLNAFLADVIIEPIEQFSIGIAGMDAVSASTPLSPIVSMLYFIAHNTTFLILANYFQRHLLIFIFQTMFTVFLPVGIILRTLPVTRGAGGFLIALSIGLYVVYPVAVSGMMLTTRTGGFGGGCQLELDAVQASGIRINDLASFEYQRSVGERELPIISALIDKYQNMFPFLLERSILLPLMALSMVFTFVRATAGFFGSDIAEISRGLLKLI